MGKASMSARKPIERAWAPLNHADQTGLAQSSMHLNAPRSQLLRDQIRRADFFERQFRMCVNVVAAARQWLG